MTAVAKEPTKTITTNLNRASKILERISVLRAESNKVVNDLLSPVLVDTKNHVTAYPRVKSNRVTLLSAMKRTEMLIQVHSEVRTEIMRVNTANGIHEVLSTMERVSNQSKFLDSIITKSQESPNRGYHSSPLLNDVLFVDAAEDVMKKMLEDAKKAEALLTMSDTPQLRTLLQNLYASGAVVSPLEQNDLNQVKEASAALKRKLNALNDELAAKNAAQIQLTLPESVAKDVGLSE